MENGKERSPLLEEDANQLIGFKSGGHSPDDGAREGITMCDVCASG